MRKIYLFTNINDRNRGPVQEAVPDNGKTCFGCALNERRLNRICSIKVKPGKHIFPSQSVCNYNTHMKSIDDLLEDL